MNPGSKDKGQREQSVGNRPPERPGGRALWINMDPLMVVCRIGETVDPVLRDQLPVGRAKLTTSRPLKLAEA